jgi:hypothetical protein
MLYIVSSCSAKLLPLFFIDSFQVYRKNSSKYATDVSNYMESQGVSTTIKLLDNTKFTSRSRVVMLADLESPLCKNMTTIELRGLQDMIRSAKWALWVTAGGLIEGATPQSSLLSGLARAIRTEQPSIQLVTLDFESPGVNVFDSQKLCKAIEAVMKAGEVGDRDNEFIYKDEMLYVSRLVPDTDLNKEFLKSHEEVAGDHVLKHGEILMLDYSPEMASQQYYWAEVLPESTTSPSVTGCIKVKVEELLLTEQVCRSGYK